MVSAQDDDASVKTTSTVNHDLIMGHKGKHQDSLVRNLEGDDFDLQHDQRLLREISMAATGLKDRMLRHEGKALLLEGNYLRNNMNKNSAQSKWPLCVPKVDVSLPGCTLSTDNKLRIYNDLAKEFARGTLDGTIKSNFVKRQREEVQNATMRRRASVAGGPLVEAAMDMSESNESSYQGEGMYTMFQLTMMRELWLRRAEKWQKAVQHSKEQAVAVHEKNLHRVTALLPGAGKPGSAMEKEGKKLWNIVGNRRLSAHSVLAPVKLKEPTDDGLCHMTLNPNPLRHISTIYPQLGFPKPGLKATSRAAFTRYYETEILRPMRYTMRYQMGQTALRKSQSAATTALSDGSFAHFGHSASGPLAPVTAAGMHASFAQGS